MDTIQILKKALGIAWRYRAMWLFGSLLALTVNNSLWLGLIRNDQEWVAENKIILSDTATIYFPGEGLTIDISEQGNPIVKIEGLEPDWYQELSKQSSLLDFRAILITAVTVLLVCLILLTFIHYTSQAALIGMVNEYERSQKTLKVIQGLRLGWSRLAGKLFLIDLTVLLPVILFLGLLFILAATPLFTFGRTGITESLVSIFGRIFLTTAGLLLFIFLTLIITMILSITRPVMHQACVVDGLSVSASIRQSFHMLKNRFSDVLITWLVWLTIRLAWPIVSIPAVIILLPILLFCFVIGGIIGAGLTLLTIVIAGQFMSTASALVIGIVLALPPFLVITFSPITFLNGLVESFKSSFWTLSYRAFRSSMDPTTQPAEHQDPVRLDAALAQ